MKTILFVLNSIPGGGIEQVLINLIEKLRTKYNIAVLSIYPSNSSYTDRVKRYSTIEFLFPKKIFIKNRVFDSLNSRIFDNKVGLGILYRAYLLNKGVDSIISFSDGLSAYLVAKYTPKRIKKIAWVHTDFTSDYRYRKNLSKFKRIYQSFGNVVFVSEALRQKFNRELGLSHTSVLYNTLDINRLKSLSIEGKSAIERSNKVEFIAIGRLSEEKGFDRLISSFSKLPEIKREKSHLTIIGEGPERKKLTHMISSNGLEDSISLTGFMENPFPSLAVADVMLVPSRFEGFGLVVVEAMALGIPIIATSTTGPSEILNYGEYGLMLPNRDNAFDDVISDVIDDVSMLLHYKTKSDVRVNDFSSVNLTTNLERLL